MKKEIFGYKSFEDLFNQYFEDLMRFVYGYVGNEEVARDIPDFVIAYPKILRQRV